MITIHRSNGESHKTDSLSYDEAMALWADPDAHFNIEVESRFSSRLKDKVGFASSSVVKVTEES